MNHVDIEQYLTFMQIESACPGKWVLVVHHDERGGYLRSFSPNILTVMREIPRDSTSFKVYRVPRPKLSNDDWLF